MHNTRSTALIFSPSVLGLTKGVSDSLALANQELRPVRRSLAHASAVRLTMVAFSYKDSSPIPQSAGLR